MAGLAAGVRQRAGGFHHPDLDATVSGDRAAATVRAREHVLARQRDSYTLE